MEAPRPCGIEGCDKPALLGEEVCLQHKCEGWALFTSIADALTAAEAKAGRKLCEKKTSEPLNMPSPKRFVKSYGKPDSGTHNPKES